MATERNWDDWDFCCLRCDRSMDVDDEPECDDDAVCFTCLYAELVALRAEVTQLNQQAEVR